ncbi:transcription elongation factor GreA, partial [Haloferax sp. Atlit-109R]
MFVFLIRQKKKEKRKIMAEKTYPMTAAEKEQLEKELEEL